MAKETEDHGKDEHDRACDVRCGAGVSSLPANDRYKKRKRGRREQHAAGVDADAADPFSKVVAMRFENKPLISEK